MSNVLHTCKLSIEMEWGGGGRNGEQSRKKMIQAKFVSWKICAQIRSGDSRSEEVGESKGVGRRKGRSGEEG